AMPSTLAESTTSARGLLGRLASTPCLLEPFHHPPKETEVRSCMLKLFAMCSQFERQAKQKPNNLKADDLPHLWILSPSCSQARRKGFGTQLKQKENWPKGVYFLAPSLRTAIVAINQLPVTRQTLWLRVLGKGETQRQAVSELEKLPPGEPLREQILELMAKWHISLQKSENLTQESQELLMNLSSAYLQWREETLQQGRQQGIQQGRQQGIQQGRQQGIQQGTLDGQRLMVEKLIEAKFSTLDQELSDIVAVIMQLPLTERSQLLLDLSNLSREELLQRFKRQ
ncbi:MAG: hypothetical protein F6K31_36165, partial [Symploca sp. SIO2G7]|nr:hypothetical protein [Symploca sp. SIO2G7]